MTAIAPSISLTLQVRLILSLLAAMWVIWFVDTLFGNPFANSFGVRPRSDKGLWGIVIAPLLHGSFRHISSNTVAFAVLAGLIALRSAEEFLVITLVVWVVSGVGAWIFGGSHTNHIGASGVIFGYLGFLLLRGYFERSVGAIALSILVALVYGQLIWFVFPIRARMSWQMHLFGFIGGVVSARFLAELRTWFEFWAW